MNLTKLTPNLMVSDLQAAVDFYHKVLGFEITTFSPEWAHLTKDDCEIMFQPAETLLQEFPELLSTNTGGVLTLFIRIGDVVTYFEQIKDGAHVIRPLGKTTYNGATEFVLQDPDGYLPHFSDVQF